MKCRDIDLHNRSRGHWVHWPETTDTFKAGDPEKAVRKVAVAWKASWNALREAVEQKADLFVTHESIGVNAKNGSPEPDVAFALPSEKEKFDWIHARGLTVYRCHDFWDHFPGEGVRDSWLRGLALPGKIIAEQGSLCVTEMAPISLRSLADHILDKIRPLGQNGMLATGDLDRKITRFATGTGVTVNPPAMKALGAEAGLITEDFYTFVRMGEHARELDFPTLTVNHGVSEEWGIRNLAGYLQKTFPELDVFHIPQKCIYTVLT